MLKQGLFIDKAGEEHLIHIVEEDQFYRIDITRAGANFHTDIEDVEYSMVKRRKTYQYGDHRLYDEYNEFYDKVHAIQCDTDKSSTWKSGKYEVTLKREKKDLNYLQETKILNGVHTSDTIILGVRSISMFVVSEVYGMKLDPINFSDYEEITLGSNDNTNVTTPYIPLSILRTRINIKHLDTKDYVVADTLEEARSRLYRWARSTAWIKGFDTETTGVDVDMYGEDCLVGIILSFDDDESTYFPFRHEEFPNLPMEFLDELMKWVIAEQSKLVAHNKKFDRKVMLKEGYDLLIRWDTMLLSFLINPVIERGAHALKELMFKLNSLRYLELSDIFTSEKLINFAKLPKDIVKYYACPDASSVITLYKALYLKLPVYQRKLFEKECELADLKADQEYYGMRVDVKKFAREYENTNYVIELLVKTFRELTKVDGNLNSPPVLNELLYNKMKCPILVRTKTNKPSTSGAAIKKLANTKAVTPHTFSHDLKDLHGKSVIKAKDLASSKYPALVVLEKYREYNKRKTAFYARFERTMRTGRIFFWINQNGAASGRQSSPMHQLPPELKAVMLSDSDEYDLWGPDFSQIELRMIAYLAGQKDLIELCCDPDNDIHRVIGSLISDKPMWAISKKERGEGKRRNFGVVYLISEYGLAGQVFGPGYTKEQVAWCKEQLNAFYARFKYITKFIRENGLTVQKKGYMMTKGYNRIRYFKEIFDPDISSKRKASLVRQANNLPVQGTAADYLKVAEVNMYNYIRNKGWYDKINGLPMVRPMLSIHDEILVSSHKSIPKEEIIEMIASCMEIPIDGAPPFFVSPALMDNWEGHSDDSLAIPIKYRDKLISDYQETNVSVFKTSQFKLILGSEVQKILQSNKNISVMDQAKLLLPHVSFNFTVGDYSTELDEHSKLKALCNYVESGAMAYEDSNYRSLLNDYRDGVLNEYMTGLLAQYGTDYKVVGTKVRHDSLTHALLARYEEQLKELDLSHEEQITEATRLYIDDTVTRTLVLPPKVYKSKELVETDKDKFFEEIDNLVNLDQNGEVVYEYPEDEEDEYVVSDLDDEGFINYITSGVVYKAWEVADAIVVDVEKLNNTQVNEVINYLWKNRDDDGFFKLYLMYGGKLVDTKFKVERLDYQEITSLINTLEIASVTC